MLHVFVAHPDARLSSLFQEASNIIPGLRIRVVRLQSTSHIFSSIRNCATAPVLVLDPWFQGGYQRETVRTLKQLRKDLLIIGASTPNGVRLADIAELVALGVSEWLTLGIDSPASAALLLKTAAGRSWSRQLAVELNRQLDPLSAAIAKQVLTAVEPPHTVKSLAYVLGFSERTLRRRLSDRGLPPPSWWIRWGRLVLAAELMEVGGVSPARCAKMMGFGTVGNLRRASRLATGLGHPARGALKDVARTLAG